MLDGREVFRHGVASFDPTADAVLLWTRLSDGPTHCDWLIARDPALRDVAASGTATTGPDEDHTVTADATGLEPATTYWYRFETAGAVSPVGRTRTLPDGGVDRLRLGLVCCAHYAAAPLSVYRALADREVDLVVHLGDYIYNEGETDKRAPEPQHLTVSLDDYRTRIAQTRADPDCRFLHQRHPMTSIWDDHDLGDNAWSGGAKDHDPERHGPWGQRARAAAQARQEWLPARLPDPGDPTKVWRSVRLGDLAELMLLDTRLAGRDLQAGEVEAKPLHDDDRSLLGDEQRAWLHERLQDPARPWALVASGTVVNELDLPFPPVPGIGRLLPNGYAVIDGEIFHDDQWDGYPAERARLAGWMEERGRAGGRSMILSGDVHASWAFQGPLSDGPDDGEPVAVEVTVPATSSVPMGRAHFAGWRAIDAMMRRMDEACFADVGERGYVIIEVTRDDVQAEWWFVDVLADDPGANAAMAAAFVTTREGWPPRFDRVTAPRPDPPRPGLPEPLPARPGDLPELRHRHRRHLVRRTVQTAALGTALLGLLLSVARRRPDGARHPVARLGH